MRSIHIKNSYNIWSPSDMRWHINKESFSKFNTYYPEFVLNRTYDSMYIEWWLHNIGYYITKPFCFINAIRLINLRCKDVDLEEWL